MMTLARHPTLLFLGLALAATSSAIAQTAVLAPGAASTAATAATDRRPDQRIERIVIEDAGARIDELRVGGETQHITVAPKGGMPAYEVIPASANRPPSAGERNSNSPSGGTRVWKIFGF